MKPTVLVVDDNPANVQVLEGILAEAGFRILPALNGESALRAAGMTRPDAVLLDVRMPGLDGYEVCRRLKAMPSLREVPVIFLSALHDVEDKIQAFRAGGVDYITKPFQTEEVLTRVRTQVELSRSRQALAHANAHLEELIVARTAELTQSNEQLRRAVLHEQAMRQLLTLANAPLSMTNFLQQSLRYLAELFGWRAPERKAAVFLTQDHGVGDRMDLIASIGMPEAQIAHCRQVDFAECLCGEAARSRRLQNIDAEHCPHDLRYPDPTPRGRVSIPLVADQHSLGVLMYTVAGIAEVPDEERQLIEQVADVLTMCIARRYADERVAYMVYYDDLTGLINRNALQERVEAELQRADRHVAGFAVLFVDLDDFKQINDVLGHEAGDEYLRLSAARLIGHVSSGDILSRWGSDEFVVLALDLDPDVERSAADAQTLAFELSEVLAQPVTVAGQEVQLNASIGIALYPGDGENAAELVQHAELAMSRAKQAGRNLIHFYRPEMQSDAARRMTLGRELRRALEARQFLLHYQPQVDGAGRLIGAEALVRWRHPERGMVSPGEFIPLAEELGLIVTLGEWVLADSVRWLGGLDGAGGALATLSVNVSARQFHEEGFAERCLAVLRAAGIPPQRIELEVTESLLLADIDGALRKIEALREAGFCFAVDDFGTGYSSLAYLKRLPVQKLKIDRSFVQDVHRDAKNAAIVRTIIALAKNLGMTTIAEGAEVREEVDFLVAAGCDAFQGYFFGKPIAPEDFSQTWLAAGAPR